MTPCPFCSPARERIILEDDDAVALLDSYPIADGHTLVVPRKHVSSVYELAADEQQRLWAFVGRVRALLVEKTGVQSFNIGVNDGIDAGQTVDHAHIHIIPRREGDVTDPRGGIRWIIAGRAAYWEQQEEEPGESAEVQERLRVLLDRYPMTPETLWITVQNEVGAALQDRECADEAESLIGSLGPEYKENPGMILDLLMDLDPRRAMLLFLDFYGEWRPYTHDPIGTITAVLEVLSASESGK